MGLKEQFLAEAGGDTVAAATALARGLMEGDEATFKAGYTAENALLAAEDVFSLDADQFRAVGLSLGAEAAFVERHAGTITGWSYTSGALGAVPMRDRESV